MSDKYKIAMQCNYLNRDRQVCYKNINHNDLFNNITGDLAISGNLDNIDIIVDLVKSYLNKNDMSNILLTSNISIINKLIDEQNNGSIGGMMFSYPRNLNYHLMYGMNDSQIKKIIMIAAQEMGYTVTDDIILYADAIIKTIKKKYIVSLPSMLKLLEKDDQFIVSFARQERVDQYLIDIILGNTSAGVKLRRIMPFLKQVFSTISNYNNTKYNFLSASIGRVPLMALYQHSQNQKLMNIYLKEELYNVIERVDKIRIIIDEAFFVNEDDELLKYIISLKRSRRIELVVISKNFLNMIYSQNIDFENMCIFGHNTIVETETVLEKVFGKYNYHYPVLMRGTPPTIFFTLKHDSRWGISSEERLRITFSDLFLKSKFRTTYTEYVAIKKANDIKIYLSPISKFIK